MPLRTLAALVMLFALSGCDLRWGAHDVDGTTHGEGGKPLAPDAGGEPLAPDAGAEPFETDADPCAGTSCGEHATCLPADGAYTCHCDPGYEGQPCEIAAKTVFVTSASFNGGLGGLAGADAKCQQLADDAGLGGTYLAWLADSTGWPAVRFIPWAGEYRRVDDVVIARGWADLIDGTLDAPISVAEDGTSVTSRAWTNVTPTTGTISNSRHCVNWTDGSGGMAPWDGVWGVVSESSSQWSLYPVFESCSVPKHLYCFEN